MKFTEFLIIILLVAIIVMQFVQLHDIEAQMDNMEDNLYQHVNYMRVLDN